MIKDKRTGVTLDYYEESLHMNVQCDPVHLPGVNSIIPDFSASSCSPLFAANLTAKQARLVEN